MVSKGVADVTNFTSDPVLDAVVASRKSAAVGTRFDNRLGDDCISLSGRMAVDQAGAAANSAAKISGKLSPVINLVNQILIRFPTKRNMLQLPKGFGTFSLALRTQSAA